MSTVPVFLVGTELCALDPLAGGLERLVCGLATALESQGVSTHLLDVSSSDPRDTLARLPHGATVVLNNRPAWSHWVTGPTIVWLHNTEEAWGDITLSMQASAMAVSPYLALRGSNVFRRTVGVLPAFIDGQFLTGNDEPPIERTPALLFPNRTLEKKGVREVLRALDTPAAVNLAVDFVLNLSPWISPTQEHSALIDEISSHRRCKLIPRRNTPADIRDLYRSHSAVLVPSTRPEGFGLVGAEALGAGVPTVVSYEGGLADLAQYGAIMADPKDPEDLGTAMVRAAGTCHARSPHPGLVDFSAANTATILRETLVSLE